MIARRSLALFGLGVGLLLAPGSAAASPWDVPPEGGCAPADGLRGWPLGQDAPPVPFKPGDVLAVEQLPMLENFLPGAIWSYRERFFFEGMKLEIGPCFRDYSPPAFFQEASEAFSGQSTLTEDGGLEGYTAGLPFPPETIAPDDPQAGAKWGWNVAHRYTGGGMFADEFRISDLVGRIGRAEPFVGEIFKVQLGYRADRAEQGYAAPGAKGRHWVAGGKFFTPQPAREFAWRQYRHEKHLTERIRSDELHAYLPEWRRVRRLNSAGVEGLYMPSFSVGTVPAKTLAAPIGGGGGVGAAGAAAAGIGGAGATTIQTKRSGFEGLEARPILYENRVLGVQDVLAPINAATPMYPETEERSFGPWGLSFAGDRWDLRRALVIEGRTKDAPGGDHTARFTKYVDLQTLHPLYYIAYNVKDEIVDVGMFVGRWSEDRADYPKWPDDPERAVRVIDSVGAAFANLAESGSWRRESWDLTAIPPADKKVKRLISAGNLTRGR